MRSARARRPSYSRIRLPCPDWNELREITFREQPTGQLNVFATGLTECTTARLGVLARDRKEHLTAICTHPPGLCLFPYPFPSR